MTQTTIDTIDFIAKWGSVAIGLLAAVLWFWSARVRMPRLITLIDDGFFDGREKPEDDLDRLTKGLTRQSLLNAWAAAGTAISVVLLAIHTALSG